MCHCTDNRHLSRRIDRHKLAGGCAVLTSAVKNPHVDGRRARQPCIRVHNRRARNRPGDVRPVHVVSAVLQDLAGREASAQCRIDRQTIIVVRNEVRSTTIRRDTVNRECRRGGCRIDRHKLAGGCAVLTSAVKNPHVDGRRARQPCIRVHNRRARNRPGDVRPVHVVSAVLQDLAGREASAQCRIDRQTIIVVRNEVRSTTIRRDTVNRECRRGCHRIDRHKLAGGCAIISSVGIIHPHVDGRRARQPCIRVHNRRARNRPGDVRPVHVVSAVLQDLAGREASAQCRIDRQTIIVVRNEVRGTTIRRDTVNRERRRGCCRIDRHKLAGGCAVLTSAVKNPHVDGRRARQPCIRVHNRRARNRPGDVRPVHVVSAVLQDLAGREASAQCRIDRQTIIVVRNEVRSTTIRRDTVNRECRRGCCRIDRHKLAGGCAIISSVGIIHPHVDGRRARQPCIRVHNRRARNRPGDVRPVHVVSAVLQDLAGREASAQCRIDRQTIIVVRNEVRGTTIRRDTVNRERRRGCCRIDRHKLAGGCAIISSVGIIHPHVDGRRARQPCIRVHNRRARNRPGDVRPVHVVSAVLQDLAGREASAQCRIDRQTIIVVRNEVRGTTIRRDTVNRERRRGCHRIDRHKLAGGCAVLTSAVKNPHVDGRRARQPCIRVHNRRARNRPGDVRPVHVVSAVLQDLAGREASAQCRIDRQTIIVVRNEVRSTTIRRDTVNRERRRGCRRIDRHKLAGGCAIISSVGIIHPHVDGRRARQPCIRVHNRRARNRPGDVRPVHVVSAVLQDLAGREASAQCRIDRQTIIVVRNEVRSTTIRRDTVNRERRRGCHRIDRHKLAGGCAVLTSAVKNPHVDGRRARQPCIRVHNRRARNRPGDVRPVHVVSAVLQDLAGREASAQCRIDRQTIIVVRNEVRSTTIRRDTVNRECRRGGCRIDRHKLAGGCAVLTSAVKNPHVDGRRARQPCIRVHNRRARNRPGDVRPVHVVSAVLQDLAGREASAQCRIDRQTIIVVRNEVRSTTIRRDTVNRECRRGCCRIDRHKLAGGCAIISSVGIIHPHVDGRRARQPCIRVHNRRARNRPGDVRPVHVVSAVLQDLAGREASAQCRIDRQTIIVVRNEVRGTTIRRDTVNRERRRGCHRIDRHKLAGGCAVLTSAVKNPHVDGRRARQPCIRVHNRRARNRPGDVRPVHVVSAVLQDLAGREASAQCRIDRQTIIVVRNEVRSTTIRRDTVNRECRRGCCRIDRHKLAGGCAIISSVGIIHPHVDGRRARQPCIRVHNRRARNRPGDVRPVHVVSAVLQDLAGREASAQCRIDRQTIIVVRNEVRSTTIRRDTVNRECRRGCCRIDRHKLAGGCAIISSVGIIHPHVDGRRARQPCIRVHNRRARNRPGDVRPVHVVSAVLQDLAGREASAQCRIDRQTIIVVRNEVRSTTIRRDTVNRECRRGCCRIDRHKLAGGCAIISSVGIIHPHVDGRRARQPCIRVHNRRARNRPGDVRPVHVVSAVLQDLAGREASAQCRIDRQTIIVVRNEVRSTTIRRDTVNRECRRGCCRIDRHKLAGGCAIISSVGIIHPHVDGRRARQPCIRVHNRRARNRPGDVRPVHVVSAVLQDLAGREASAQCRIDRQTIIVVRNEVRGTTIRRDTVNRERRRGCCRIDRHKLAGGCAVLTSAVKNPHVDGRRARQPCIRVHNRRARNRPGDVRPVHVVSAVLQDLAGREASAQCRIDRQTIIVVRNEVRSTTIRRDTVNRECRRGCCRIDRHKLAGGCAIISSVGIIHPHVDGRRARQPCIRVHNRRARNRPGDVRPVHVVSAVLQDLAGREASAQCRIDRQTIIVVRNEVRGTTIRRDTVNRERRRGCCRIDRHKLAGGCAIISSVGIIHPHVDGRRARQPCIRVHNRRARNRPGDVRPVHVVSAVLQDLAGREASAQCRIDRQTIIVVRNEVRSTTIRRDTVNRECRRGCCRIDRHKLAGGCAIISSVGIIHPHVDGRRARQPCIRVHNRRARNRPGDVRPVHVVSAVLQDLAGREASAQCRIDRQTIIVVRNEVRGTTIRRDTVNRERRRGCHRIDGNVPKSGRAHITSGILSRCADRLSALSHRSNVGIDQCVRPRTVAVRLNSTHITSAKRQRNQRIRLSRSSDCRLGFRKVDHVIPSNLADHGRGRHNRINDRNVFKDFARRNDSCRQLTKWLNFNLQICAENGIVFS